MQEREKVMQPAIYNPLFLFQQFLGIMLQSRAIKDVEEFAFVRCYRL